MAGFRKQAGTAKGRGFGTVDGVDSLLKKVKVFFETSIEDGGCGWYVISDQSALSVGPFIVVANKPGQPTNASRHKILRCSLSATANRVQFVFYMHHNITTHVSSHPLNGWTLATDENVEYGFNFRGGAEALLLMTNVAGNWQSVYLIPFEGIPLLLENDFTATLAQDYTAKTGDDNNQVGNVFNLTGVGPVQDADGKLQISVDANGSSSQILVYNNAARTSDYLVGQSTMASPITAATISAVNNSGLGGTINRMAIALDDFDIEVDFKLYVGAGEGALFTVGKTYYIWDYVSSTSSTRVGYFKVLDIIGDALVVSGLDGRRAFTAGACISPYGHRYLVGGSSASGNGGAEDFAAQIPYYSAYANPWSNCYATANGTQAFYTWLTTATGRMSPNDDAKYGVMRPIVYEHRDYNGFTQNSGSTNANLNRLYGRLLFMYVSSVVGMATMQFGRTINGKEYITFLVDSATAYLFLDSESLS